MESYYRHLEALCYDHAVYMQIFSLISGGGGGGHSTGTSIGLNSVF